jgi:hypothetical protein
MVRPRARMNTIGLTAFALVAGAPVCVSKCRCGPDAEPDIPTYPMTWPSATTWPQLLVDTLHTTRITVPARAGDLLARRLTDELRPKSTKTTFWGPVALKD